MTRNGKIARLPKAVRHELNCRLSEGEPGESLVDWLNERDDVKKVLAASFGGRPVSEQNLSEWRAGGYLDWQRHQETLELAQRMMEEGDDIERLSKKGPLTDRMAEMAALALMGLLRAADRMEDGPEKHRRILEVVRELNRLRRADREMERACREAELHACAMEDREEQKEREETSRNRREIMLQGIFRSEGERMKELYVKTGKPVPKDMEGLLRAVGVESGTEAGAEGGAGDAEQGAEEEEKAEGGAGRAKGLTQRSRRAQRKRSGGSGGAESEIEDQGESDSIKPDQSGSE